MAFRQIKATSMYKKNSMYGACVAGDIELFRKLEKMLLEEFKKVNENYESEKYKAMKKKAF